MDNQTYQQIIGEIGTVITIVSPLLVAFIGAYKLKVHEFFEAKINNIKDDNLKRVAQNTLNRVESLTTSTITMLDATIKPQIVENIKNGTMTKDNLLSLKQQCIETVKKQLTNEGLVDLQNTVGDVNTYMDILVESKLADLKVDNNSSVSKTEITLPTSEELDNVSLKNQLSQVQTQLQSTQSEKDNLSQQLVQIQSDKVNIEQNNQQLAIQVNDLTTQNSNLNQQVLDLTNKLNAITQVVQPQTVQTPVDNTAQVQA